jgi:hypothetical protein
MDSVSVETSPENEWVKQRIVEGKVRIKKTLIRFIHIQKKELSIKRRRRRKRVEQKKNYFLWLKNLNGQIKLSFVENLCHAFRQILFILKSDCGQQQ